MRTPTVLTSGEARGWFLSPSKGQPGSGDRLRASGPSTGSGTGHPTSVHYQRYSWDTTLEITLPAAHSRLIIPRRCSTSCRSTPTRSAVS